MTTRILGRLSRPTAHRQIDDAPDGWLWQIKPPTRNDKQNRLLHGWIGQVAKNVDWAGKRRDVDTWKRLLVAGWLRARGEQIEILPALDGHGVDIVWRPTSKLTRPECAELTEFVIAWAVDHGVDWADLPDGRS